MIKDVILRRVEQGTLCLCNCSFGGAALLRFFFSSAILDKSRAGTRTIHYFRESVRDPIYSFKFPEKFIYLSELPRCVV
jgi:hypothetical protein